MSPEKLVRMANQIAQFFAHLPEQAAAEQVADHLRKFWDPRMRAGILAQADAEALTPAARRAVAALDPSLSDGAPPQ